MERKRKVRLPTGQEFDAVELTFRSPGENFNEYLVDDGTVVRVKTVVTEILRIEGLFDGDGNPVYRVNSSQVLAVSAPEELRRKEGGE